MSISEQSAIDRIEVLDTGVIQVRRATVVARDGREIAREYHRYLLEPGADLDGQDARVVAVARATWTADVLAAWQQAQAAEAATVDPAGAALAALDQLRRK